MKSYLMSRRLAGGEELRTGSAGVPLATADEFYRRVFVNKERPRRVACDMGYSEEVCVRMHQMLKRHGLPSVERRILLSIGYPDRTYAEIAAAFGVDLSHVNDVVLRAERIRRKEPLSTELWEDITEDTMMPDEVYARAAEVRRQNALDQGQVLTFAKDGTPIRAGVRNRVARPWNRCRSWEEGGDARPQPQEGFLPEPGCDWDGEPGDQDEELEVHCPF